LQSLTLANDPMFFEIAQGLALRTLKATQSDAGVSERVDLMFRCCLSRAPGPDEASVLEHYWTRERARFEQDAEAARQAAPRDCGALASLCEAAAWTSVARVLLNTDEFVSRN
jgi:hypothetical protein